MFRASLDLSRSGWMPIMVATDRLCTLSMAFSPELIENWLNAIGNGATLLDWESKGLLLVNVEPLVHLTNKKTELLHRTNNIFLLFFFVSNLFTKLI